MGVENDPVFESPTREQLDVVAFGTSVPRLCKGAGLGRPSVHEVRHSCASLILNETGPWDHVCEPMGYTSILLAEDVEGHLMPRS